MTALAREEMGHFQMVHNRMIQRGLVLGRERRDEYVNELHTYFPKEEIGMSAWFKSYYVR